MNNFISLNILDKFRFLYEKLGIDYDTMRLILSIKLTLDSRKTSNLLERQQFDQYLDQYKTVQIIYTIIGFFMMFIIIMSKNTLVSMATYFAMFMFFIATNFMSDFSSVILDVKDKSILATRGIDLKTLNASKITHVMIYMVKISIALSGFSLIASLKYGLLFSLVFLIEIFLINIFMLMFSGLIYLLLLKLFNGSKLKDAITIIQIGVTILFSLTYILVINLSTSIDLFKSIHLGAIRYFLPPFWFASLLEIIATKHINKTLLILSFLALVTPLISALIYIKLTPIFEKNLQKLNNNESSNNNIKKYKFQIKLSKIVCKDKEERIFFDFFSRMLKVDRDFKTTVYTTIGSNLIGIFVILDRNVEDIGVYIYLFLYSYVTIVPTIIIALKFSRNCNASYIYKTIPIKNKMNVHKAAIKACLANVIIPIYIISSIVFMNIYEVTVIQHIIIIFLITIFIAISTFIILNKKLPFSQPPNIFKKNYAILDNYLMVVLTLIMAGIHFVISLFGTLPLNIYIIAILIINIILYKLTFRVR
ncbi:hypothetical protein [Romboutsia lituseburensis]|uniref:hypothetical protein n=1 Tax=Romboutsia lituseburensis TaxID=1537 RepID=UPI00215AC27D|nr:hypothetical protein [Romboutsia lituseburensis]MCR8744394.1 hypothetical protein [Romboutsia lituseburensis]